MNPTPGIVLTTSRHLFSLTSSATGVVDRASQPEFSLYFCLDVGMALMMTSVCASLKHSLSNDCRMVCEPVS